MLRFEHRARGELQQDEGPCAAPDFATAEVRRLNASHLADFQHLLTGLDQPSRCARFGWAASDAALAAHANNAIASARIIFGVFHDRQLRGALEIYDGGAAGSAEVALIVAAAWRRRSFGWALLQSAMHWAAEIDAGPMRLIFSRHNWPMRHLTAKAAATFDIVLDEISAEITTPRIPLRLARRVPA